MSTASKLLTALNEMNDQYADGGVWRIKDLNNYQFEDENGSIYYVTYDKGYRIEKTTDKREGYVSTSHDQGTPRAARALLANARWSGKLDGIDLDTFEAPDYIPRELRGI